MSIIIKFTSNKTQRWQDIEKFVLFWCHVDVSLGRWLKDCRRSSVWYLQTNVGGRFLVIFFLSKCQACHHGSPSAKKDNSDW